MSKITRSFTDRQEMPKPQRKRRKKDLDRIHSKILQAKRKLDNVGKSGDKAGQKRQGRAKICNRLLLEPKVAGIFRNGAKSKDVQKAGTSADTYHEARLNADALKLFNGNTNASKCIVEVPKRDKTTEQSPNEGCTKDKLEWKPCIFVEQSPVLGKRQNLNQKPCPGKKKGEENLFEDVDSDKTKKQNVNDKSRHVQKENVCKRRLFQNDKKQLETITQQQIFDTIDLTNESETNEEEAKPSCSKNSKDLSCDSLSRYMEICKIVSGEPFEADILPNCPDPLTTTLNKLRQIYTDSFHKQLLRNKNKQESENVEPALHPAEYQACIYSDTSQLSSVEFEVPKLRENHTIATRLQESVSQKDNEFHPIQNVKLKKRDGVTRYNSTSRSSPNTAATTNINGSVAENCENSNIQCSNQSKSNFRQPSKSTGFYYESEKDSDQLDSQKNPNYANRLLKSKRHDKDNFSFDTPSYTYRGLRRTNNLDLFGNSVLLRNNVPSKRHFSKDHSREKLPIAVSDNHASNNVPQKCNNIPTKKCNVKNVKRQPTILRRSNDIVIDKPNHFVQTNGDYAEGLYEKREANLFNRNPSNGVERDPYEAAFKNPTSITTNAMFDQTKILKPQVGSMKIKDSQESLVEQFDRNMRPNERNEFCRYDNSLYPRSFEASYNPNAYTEKLSQQEQTSSDMKKYYSNNYRPINYLQGVGFSNLNTEPTKQFPQQTKLRVCEVNKQKLFRKDTRDQNQNILFDNVNGRAIPTQILNYPQNIQIEDRPAESNLFVKTYVECDKNQINQNAYHCNEQYVYLDSANCPGNYKEQAHYVLKETAQPESLCVTRDYNNSVDNCVNLSSATRNIPLLSLAQKSELHTYSKATDDQHRAVLLQNVTQPVKYLAVKNGSDIQRIPVYINDRSVRVAEKVPLKVIALMNPNTQQTKAFPQEIATQVVPLNTDSLHFNDFAAQKVSDQSFVKHLDSVNAILVDPNSQSNICYASNL